MLRLFLWLTCLCYFAPGHSQSLSVISGTILDARTHKPIPKVRVCIEDCYSFTVTAKDGGFLLTSQITGSMDLLFSLSGYREIILPVNLIAGEQTKLGLLYMEPIETGREAEASIESLEEMIAESTARSGFTPLNAYQGIYENRSAFNFSQAFYRIRGYDARYREVTLNGIRMNEPDTGSPQFALWGGLNDMFRERESVSGMKPSRVTFGTPGGGVHYSLRPSLNRKGLRLSTSASNRFYNGRIMASYSSGGFPSGFTFSVSASKRWAEQGYVDGTLYDAASFFASLEYDLSEKDALVFTGFYAPRRRGSRTALTEELVGLAGSRYNPFWGYHGKKQRNSRVKKINQPVFILNYFHRSPKLNWQAGLLYKAGYRSSGRLGYYDAPNPDPSYYRYLPSFHMNGDFINYENAMLAEKEFRRDPQLRWEELYKVNMTAAEGGKAYYLLYDDKEVMKSLVFSFNAVLGINRHNELRIGVDGRKEDGRYFAEITDMLGAEFHIDRDPFTDTSNHLEDAVEKKAGDTFRYHYAIPSLSGEAFLQFHRNFSGGDAYLAVSSSYLQTHREGYFTNERYPENSSGRGDPIRIFGMSFKGGLNYQISGRHIVSLNAGYIEKTPQIRSLYINPRENHTTMEDLVPEKILTGELNYRMDLPVFKTRTSFFYSEFSGLNEVGFYYYEGVLGNTFVQEAAKGVSKRHYGGEFSLAYELSPAVTLDLVMGYGSYRYFSDPLLTLNFNTVNEEETIDPDGTYDLGRASLDGLYLAQGPQSAVSIGVKYNSPQYWWLGACASYLDRNYIGVSEVRRTESFFSEEDPGEQVSNLSPALANDFLDQEMLPPIYYLDLNGGKSWLISNTYVSLFLSVNNLFNTPFRTGGYEQDRLANAQSLYEDRLGGHPSFGNKYWYGAGRTYFLNLAVNF